MPAELPAEIPVELILPGTPTHDVPVDVVDDEPSGVAGDTINVPAGGDITDVVADDVEVAPKGDTVSDVVGGSGLTPPLPISNEPNGIPARAAPPGVVGDVAAADEALLLAVVPQGPDIAVLPGIDVPVPIDIPPPSKVGVDPDIADDALPVVVQGNGLSPGEASCVTPMGMPVGGTCEPGVMPSGEVAAILGVGLPIPPTCARAEPQLSSTVAAVTIAKRVIMGSTFYSRSRRSFACRSDAVTMQSNARTWLRVDCCGLRDVVSIGWETLQYRPRPIRLGRIYLADALRLHSRDASMIAARRLPGDLPERGGE